MAVEAAADLAVAPAVEAAVPEAESAPGVAVEAAAEAAGWAWRLW